jgi:hypothetical protein
MSFGDHVINVLEGILGNAVNHFIVVPLVGAFVAVARKLRAIRRRSRRRNTVITTGKVHTVSLNESITITTRTGALVINTPADPMPPGTASAIATAMQALPERPHFVDNGQWTQWSAYQQQHDQTAWIVLQSSMPKFNPALFG